jgi:hypothetical protein
VQKDTDTNTDLFGDALHVRFADVPIIGLSATPWPRGLGKHFDELIVGTTTQLVELKSRSIAAAPTVDERRTFFAGLKRIAQTRGDKPGRRPTSTRNALAPGQTAPLTVSARASPSLATRRWVQSRNIAWAKSQRRGAG